MGSDIEAFVCMIFNTNYMIELLYGHPENLEKYANMIEILENWENFKSVEDIKKLNNKHINKAIEEIEQDNVLMKTLKDETSLYD